VSLRLVGCGCQIRSADERYRDVRGSAACLDSIVGSNAFNQPVSVWPCHGEAGNQVIKQFLSRHFLCLHLQLVSAVAYCFWARVLTMRRSLGGIASYSLSSLSLIGLLQPSDAL